MITRENKKHHIMNTTHTVNAAAETLREILEQIPVSQKEVAESTGIPSAHLSGLKNGSRRFTPEYDLRLSRYFSQSEGFWLRLDRDSIVAMTFGEWPK